MSTLVSPIGGRAIGRPAAPKEIEMFRFIESNLYTAVIADVLDEFAKGPKRVELPSATEHGASRSRRAVAGSGLMAAYFNGQ